MVGGNISIQLLCNIFHQLFNIFYQLLNISHELFVSSPEESRLKRANLLMFAAEWKACKREEGENGCLYTRSLYLRASQTGHFNPQHHYRLPNFGKLEGNGVSYCTSIGPSQDSNCCLPKVGMVKSVDHCVKVSEPDYPGAMCHVNYIIPVSWDEFSSKIRAQVTKSATSFP